MKKTYIHIEKYFEQLTSAVTAILGNSITFIIAFGTVVVFFINNQFYTQSLHDCIADVFLGITFLSLFIIQKAFNRFSGSLHVKVNELVASNDTANNAVINVEHKTELEIHELQKEYTELVDHIKEVDDKIEGKE